MIYFEDLFLGDLFDSKRDRLSILNYHSFRDFPKRTLPYFPHLVVIRNTLLHKIYYSIPLKKDLQ